jgi:SAM-dependent methyltransferase
MSTTLTGGDWGDGYIVDIAYLPGYFRQQSPAHLNLACLLGGFAGIDSSPVLPLSYLELGCGYGFSALALAAANPRWRVTGIDFNPGHVAAARSLAAEAGIANAQFIEADLAELAAGELGPDIPESDVVAAHGIWSWVGDGARAGIVRLLGSRLRPGGLLYVSYNALPAWSSGFGMQRLLREAGSRLASRSDKQAAAGLDILRALSDANARQLRDPFVRAVMERNRQSHPNYLAHEFMNAAWRPAFHADVVLALRSAKLDWVASAALLENFSPLMLHDEARAVFDRFDEPLMRELVKDMCLDRALRQDVFVRGARRLSAYERDAALGEVTLALACPIEKFVWEFEVPVGKATIERGFFGPIVAALAESPKRVCDLLALPDLPRRDNPGELVGMLVGTGQVLPLSGQPAEPEPQVLRLNALAARRFARLDNLTSGMALATSGSGTPLPCAMVELLVGGNLCEAAPSDLAEQAKTFAAAALPEEQAKLVETYNQILHEWTPLWRTLGALPGHTIRS